MIYQARWTCQCGEGAVIKFTDQHEGTAASMAVALAIIDGYWHQEDGECEVLGVKVTEAEKVEQEAEDD